MAGCRLCPRLCNADRSLGERGACGADDKLLVSHVMLHHWEEPPISGTAGSGTIFFPGCSLRCAYCQNQAISRSLGGRESSVDDLASEMISLQEAGAMNVNLVSPTHFASSIRASIHKARERGLRLPIVWNTSGYETVEALRDNAGFVNVYLTDFKYADSHLAGQLSGAADYPTWALEALAEMIAQVGEPVYDDHQGSQRLVRGVVVRHLILPGQVEASLEMLRLLRSRFGSGLRLSLMSQYTPVIPSGSPILCSFPELGRALTSDEYECVLDAADELGFEDYFWQEGDPAQESFIPDFDI